MTTIPRPAARALLATALVSAVLSGCSDSSADASAGARADGPAAGKPDTTAGVTLAATLDSPIDITLRWSGRDPGAAGHVVEFATERQGPYTVLQFAPPGRRTYTHPDLIPMTPFYYRLRPYYGPASDAVGIALPPGGFGERDQRKDHGWAEPRKLPRDERAGAPRHPVTGGPDRAAAPTGLKATVMHANGVKLTWQDHARDEVGYLIEVRPAGEREYRVAAVLDADIESAGLITLPQEKKAAIRVRPLRYGQQSNIVHRTTGAETSG
ncbi:fibronectin type III domain-containing protein [Streptomyces sp. NBC_00306]|uniref:fibronectin type III domain-containing protein n=1 Tax=Streptomyces sp. NBC_00306 TaxID=2975708 RepID=UPI002E2A6118|nr:fibronectin type III domain-containing protein [Streptomyces sp. NBC_00306]